MLLFSAADCRYDRCSSHPSNESDDGTMDSQPLPEPRTVNSPAAFRDCIARGEEPAVLRGAAARWAAVRASSDAGEGIAAYLRRRDTGVPVYAIVGRPDIDGGFGYDSDVRSVNYDARQTPLSAVLDRLPEAARGGFAVAVQAAPASRILRDWDGENATDLVPKTARPRLWMSMASRVAPHSDVHDNVAVVVAGRRRFTLYPPEQIANLYLGPLLSSPGGVPTSSVNIRKPDAGKHPRYAKAAASATRCTLDPGDAIFIPSLWWHAVESLAALNVLVNYWFSGDEERALPLSDTLSHAMLAISHLPRTQRARWKRYFDHLVFRLDEDPAQHLSDDLEDLLSTPSAAQRETIMRRIVSNLDAQIGSRDGHDDQ